MTALFIQKCGYYGPRLMKEFGLSAEDAAAVLGNLGHESGGFVHLQELGKHHGSGGLGPGQWTGARRHAFEAWCRAHGVSTASDEGGCGYLIAELHGPESGAIAALKRSSGLEGKVRAFERVFERAGVPAISRRVTWARLALSALHPGHSASVAPPPRARRKPIADKHRGHH